MAVDAVWAAWAGLAFRAAAQPQLRLLLIGQTTSALGSAMLPIALSFAILANGGTAFDIGVVFGTVFIAELALYLVGRRGVRPLPATLGDGRR